MTTTHMVNLETVETDSHATTKVIIAKVNAMRITVPWVISGIDHANSLQCLVATLLLSTRYGDSLEATEHLISIRRYHIHGTFSPIKPHVISYISAKYAEIMSSKSQLLNTANGPIGS